MEDPNANQQMLLKALVIKEEHYGECHPAVAMTLTNLSNAYSRLGDFRTQKELLERALKIEENDDFQVFFEKFGIDASDVGATLGNAHRNFGDYGKAKEVYERALEMTERHHGKDHFEVARTLGILGNNLRDIKDYEKAKEFLERALEMKEQYFGKDLFEVAITLYNLALTHGCLGDQKKKVELLKRVLPIYQNHYGVHSDLCAKVIRAIDEPTRSKWCVRRWVVIGLQLLLQQGTDSGLWSSRNAKAFT